MSLLLALSCIPTETGIDGTTLSGVVEIPPAVTEEHRDAKASPSDTILLAQDLGNLSWRWERIDGEIRRFQSGADEENPADSDYTVFRPAASGTFTIVFEYGTPGAPEGPLADSGDSGSGDSWNDDSLPDSGDSGPDSGVDTGPEPDSLLYDVYLYDLDQDVHVHDPEAGDTYENSITPLAGGSTQGAGGVYVIEAELEAGKEYALGVLGIAKGDDDEKTYSVWLSGSSPEDGTLMIGAYTDAADYLNRGQLVAGAAVNEWTYDEDTRTWAGAYEMVTFKTVTSEEGVNQFEEPVGINTVTEGVQGPVYLVGGDFKNLNQGLPAGTLHNATTVEVAVKADQANTADAVVFDTIAPKIVGWEFAEEEPNDFLVDEESGEFVEGSMGGGTVLPMASGLGFVDIVTGTLDVTEEGGGSVYPDTENDVFVLTVPEELDVQITTSWTNDDYNFDMSLYDENEEFIGSGYQIADVNPEVMPLGAWEVTLEPDKTYYLVMQTWTGPIGSDDYRIELEWLGL